MELNTPGGRRGEGQKLLKKKALWKKGKDVRLYSSSRPFPGRFQAVSRLFTAGTGMFSNLLKLQMLRGLLVVALLQEGQRG